ncbi:hypothetical protein TSA1_19795 [Bradyrhizobium nitroreducens]|uniref:Uncharacterized protein n=1 Tax=Bradyrhizobium nitroreducens TaxID=709803 RepID=A0A2M6UDW2_9BRAD|nr:hypothetical protein [Bradyrhizobium nitroreducens]PIT02745.1 hypothetical protein TSA1_19795 [Bradyrhizobium nitroreducens]
MPEFHFVIELAGFALALVSVGFVLFEIRAHGRRGAQELRIQEERLKFDNTKWQFEAEHIGAQASRLEKFAFPLADRLKDQLKADPEWIADALRRSELFPYESSIFGRRSEHYKEEKNCLAQQFSALLVPHLEQLAEVHPRICLIIDSGTTLYPLFEHLGKAVLAADRSAPWVDKVEIITNNLPGVFNLMRATRSPSTTDAPRVPIKCTVVAGQLLTSYVAVTGEDTQTSIKTLLDDREGSYNISLVTGNWVRLRRKHPICPIPLARGPGHLDFKQTIMNVSNENYIIAPLGKLLDITKAHAEQLLRAEQLLANSRESYHEVNTEHPDSPVSVDSVRLVTTYRAKASSILYRYSASVRASLDPENTTLKRELRDMRHVFVSFDPESDDVDTQKVKEFPHPNTHDTEFYKLFLIH